MSFKNRMLAGVIPAMATLAANVSLAQIPPPPPTVIYTLVKGSQLVDECPICDRMPIVAPMTGTFRLQALEPTPLFNRYALQNISLIADSGTGFHYVAIGSGTYEAGGEVLLAYNLFLDVDIDNGSTNTTCLCSTNNAPIVSPWPTIQITVDQTNGTFLQTYHLTLVAEPALQILAITPDLKSGNVRLDWDANGQSVQLQGAPTVAGPFVPLTPFTTDQTFTDVAALANHPQGYFYRLQRK